MSHVIHPRVIIRPAPTPKVENDNFSEDEEAFFAEGTAVGMRRVESFDDLDTDYDLPRTFWQKLRRPPGQPLADIKKRKPRDP